MFDKVLVGVDGRQGGQDAIALARQLAAPSAKVTLAHVYGGPTAGGHAAALAVPFELEATEQLLTQTATQSGMPVDTASICESSVGRGLHTLAEQRDAELLVVGSCHRGKLGQVLVGDDTSRALNGAPCAIAIAPRGYTEAQHDLRTVGIGYDGSAESEHALTAARQLASRHGATVKALWVVSLENVREERPIPADWPQTAQLLVARCLDQLRRIDGVEGDAVYGGPREELSGLSDRVDLLVIGSRGYGPIGRLFHGSVSSYLVKHVSCPLLVLPRSASGQDELNTAGRETEVPVVTAA